MTKEDANASSDGDAAEELANFIRCESESSSSSSVEVVRRHALSTLVESRLGADVTAAARRLAAEGSTEDGGEGCWREAARELTETPAFRRLQEVVVDGASKLSGPVAVAAGEERAADAAASKKAKTPRGPATAAAPAPVSFSLFDMLDSGGGGFSLAPRITARDIIDAYRREKNDAAAVSSNSNNSNGNVMARKESTARREEESKPTTTLELLEKAEDVEDLSPDPDTWEEVRQILYEGLLSRSESGDVPDDDMESSSSHRFLKVHDSLHEKCRGNEMFAPQLWGLAQNLVGAVLSWSRWFGEASEAPARRALDIFWDLVVSFQETLTRLATDHVVSCVGNEREVERTLLGLCRVLADDAAACVLAMTAPLRAGDLEVWARLVTTRRRFAAAIWASGLGGAALRRCRGRGENPATARLCRGVGVALADAAHGNFLQALSILRTVLFRCGGSREVVGLIRRQCDGGSAGAVRTSFLSSCCVAGPDEVQDLLDDAEKELNGDSKVIRPEEVQIPSNGAEEKQGRSASQEEGQNLSDASEEILKPFCQVMQVKASNPSMVDYDLEVLCTQTIQLIQSSQ